MRGRYIYIEASNICPQKFWETMRISGEFDGRVGENRILGRETKRNLKNSLRCEICQFLLSVQRSASDVEHTLPRVSTRTFY